jgi:hypothetical protein
MMWDPAEGEAAALWDLDDAEVERLRAAASGGTPAGGAVAGVLGTPSTGAAGGWCVGESWVGFASERGFVERVAGG